VSRGPSAVADGPRDASPITGALSVGPTATDRLQGLRRRHNKQPTVVVFIDLHYSARPVAVTKFSKSSILDKVPEGSTLILELSEFPYNTV